MITCPSCGSDDITGAGKADDGRLRVHCEQCGHDWLRGEARPQRLDTFEAVKGAVPETGGRGPAAA